MKCNYELPWCNRILFALGGHAPLQFVQRPSFKNYYNAHRISIVVSSCRNGISLATANAIAIRRDAHIRVIIESCLHRDSCRRLSVALVAQTATL